MLRQSWLIGIVLLGLAGCTFTTNSATSAMQTAPPDSFVHRVATSELVLLWNCQEPGAGVLRVDGIGQNPWQAQPIQNLEVRLVGVDAQERTTAQVSGTARDYQIFTNQNTPFQLELKTTGTEARFDLYYQYRFHEEFDMGARRGSLVAGPPMMGPLAQMQNHMVRDACGANQHRAH